VNGETLISTDKRASDMSSMRPSLPDFWRRADISVLMEGFQC
jgi:hypothetical protein